SFVLAADGASRPGARAPAGAAPRGLTTGTILSIIFAGVLRPEASIVVVHHRGPEHRFEALASLEESLAEGLTAEILLVDNAAGTPQDEILRKHPNIRRIPSATNVGFAAGCRLGVDAARAPIVLFVNDDAAVETNAPRLLVSALTSADADIVAVGGQMTDRTGQRNDFFDGFLTFDG